MSYRFRPIQSRVVSATALTYVVVLLISLALVARGERNLVDEIGVDRARDAAWSYFDGLNAMLVSGAMDQKSGFRDKLVRQGNVRQIRIVHADVLKDGLVQKLILHQDEFEHRALAGEEVSVLGQAADRRVLTYVAPIRASSNYLGKLPELPRGAGKYHIGGAPGRLLPGPT